MKTEEASGYTTHIQTGFTILTMMDAVEKIVEFVIEVCILSSITRRNIIQITWYCYVRSSYTGTGNACTILKEKPLSRKRRDRGNYCEGSAGDQDHVQ
jgi:hypothetical protein